MPIQFKELGHIALRCKNYIAMHDFYTNKLGLDEKFHFNRPNGDLWLSYILAGNGQYIELFPEEYQGNNSHGTHSHAYITLQVGHIINTLEQLSSKGVPIYDAPMGKELLAPFSALSPDYAGNLSAWLCDPERNWICLMRFLSNGLHQLCSQ